MMDEREFAIWRESLDRCVATAKATRRKQDSGVGSLTVDVIFAPARACYSELTGAPETHHNEIWNHQLSKLGPACGQCGKPLRTPHAKLCAECGQPSGRPAA